MPLPVGVTRLLLRSSLALHGMCCVVCLYEPIETAAWTAAAARQIAWEPGCPGVCWCIQQHTALCKVTHLLTRPLIHNAN